MIKELNTLVWEHVRTRELDSLRTFIPINKSEKGADTYQNVLDTES